MSERREAGEGSDSPFVGTWRLIAWEVTEADGTVRHPYGRRPVGFLFYTADGFMAAEIMDPDRRQGEARFPVEPAFEQTLPDEDRLAAYGTYLSYCGTYTFSIEEGTVVHHVQAGLIPSWVGSDQPRSFELEGGRLTLGSKRARLVWERAVGHA